jgi:hypothetical protein
MSSEMTLTPFRARDKFFLMSDEKRLRRLRVVAYHEAGHAVAAWSLGVGLRDITIVPRADALGSVKHARIFSKRVHEHLELLTSLRSFEGETGALRTAVISLAGIVAQRRYAPRSVPNANWDSDYAGANLMAERVCCGDEKEMQHWYRRAFRRTERLIEWRWPAVEALASALLKKRKLSGKEAIAAIQNPYKLPKAEKRRLAEIVAGLNVIRIVDDDA